MPMPAAAARNRRSVCHHHRMNLLRTAGKNVCTEKQSVEVYSADERIIAA